MPAFALRATARFVLTLCVRRRGDEVAGSFHDRGAALGGANVAARITHADAVAAKLGEGFGDGGFITHAVDDEVPFLGGEFLGDAEADAA